jgi:hypothetical protein
MDCMMDETARRKGSTKRKEERNRLREEQGANFDKLAGVAKVTCGHLAMNKIYCITKALGGKVMERKAEEQRKKSATNQKGQQQKE